MQVGNLLHKWNVENDQACNKLATSFQLVRLVGCSLYVTPNLLLPVAGHTHPHHTSGTLPGTEHGQSLTCCNSLLAVVAVFLVRFSRD